MHCPHCASVTTKEQTQQTTLGYRTFRCSVCKRLFNERTGTPFNFLEYPTDIVLLVVLWRLRYKLSLRDLAEMFLERGVTFTYESVREWERRFAPLLTEHLRTKRRGQAGQSWYLDETYVRVKGKWCYLYRAIDAEGNLIDSRLSEKRNMEFERSDASNVLAEDRRLSVCVVSLVSFCLFHHFGCFGYEPLQHRDVVGSFQQT
jgi:putative transposase